MRFLLVVTALCCWWTGPAFSADTDDSGSDATDYYRSAAFDLYQTRCVVDEFDELAAKAGWDTLTIGLGYKPPRIYSLAASMREDCRGATFSEAIRLADRQAKGRSELAELAVARIEYGAKGGVCLGAGFTLLFVAGGTAARNSNSVWPPHLIVGIGVLGAGVLVMIPVGVGLLGRAAASDREFDRRKREAHFSIAPWPGGVTVRVAW